MSNASTKQSCLKTFSAHPVKNWVGMISEEYSFELEPKVFKRLLGPTAKNLDTHKLPHSHA